MHADKRVRISYQRDPIDRSPSACIAYCIEEQDGNLILRVGAAFYSKHTFIKKLGRKIAEGRLKETPLLIPIEVLMGDMNLSQLSEMAIRAAREEQRIWNRPEHRARRGVKVPAPKQITEIGR